jgi:hypothetical protein
MVAPFPVKPFDQMTKKEAKQYFDWYVGQMDERISILKRVFKETGGEGDLDGTPDSLTPLWNWFVKIVEGRRLNQRELDEQICDARRMAAVAKKKGVQVDAALISALERHFIDDAKQRGIVLSENTKSISVDVAFYLVSVLQSKFPTVHWRIGSGKNYVYYNQPVVGLLPKWSYDFKPSAGVSGMAWDIANGELQPNRFLRWYDQIREKLRQRSVQGRGTKGMGVTH